MLEDWISSGPCASSYTHCNTGAKWHALGSGWVQVPAHGFKSKSQLCVSVWYLCLFSKILLPHKILVESRKLSHSSHRLAKQCSKFSKPGFNRAWTVSFQMLKVDLEKAEEPEIKLPTSIGSLKKQENPRKTSTSALLIMPKSVTVWIRSSCGKFWKSGNTRPPDLPPKKSVCRSRSNSQIWTWNNGLAPNWERSRSTLNIVTLLL